jgi:hypothetical protein
VHEAGNSTDRITLYGRSPDVSFCNGPEGKLSIALEWGSDLP